ncbi:unnamed protein product, partial [Ixodes pacificus]
MPELHPSKKSVDNCMQYAMLLARMLTVFAPFFVTLSFVCVCVPKLRVIQHVPRIPCFWVVRHLWSNHIPAFRGGKLAFGRFRYRLLNSIICHSAGCCVPFAMMRLKCRC